MKFLQDDTVPWQRVISSAGAISDRGDGGEAARRQADRLREEGVEVTDALGGGVSTATHRGGGIGSLRVSLATYGWCEYKSSPINTDMSLTFHARHVVPDSVQLDDD